MKYCGINRPRYYSKRNSVSFFNSRGVIAEGIGDKILKAVELGADMGSPVPVKYDDEGVDCVDVMTSPNHDFFDIAEQYGEQVAESVGGVPTGTELQDTSGSENAPVNPEPVKE